MHGPAHALTWVARVEGEKRKGGGRVRLQGRFAPGKGWELMLEALWLRGAGCSSRYCRISGYLLPIAPVLAPRASCGDPRAWLPPLPLPALSAGRELPRCFSHPRRHLSPPPPPPHSSCALVDAEGSPAELSGAGSSKQAGAGLRLWFLLSPPPARLAQPGRGARLSHVYSPPFFFSAPVS